MSRTSERGDLNSQVVANRLASSLERGWYFRKAGQSMLRRVMDSGARGCEIVISGKLTGPRSRTEKFIAGYIKHSGKPAIEIVDKGYSVAIKKLGVIGCQVRIIPPDVTPPDQFKIIEVQVPEAKAKAEAPAPAAETKPSEEKKSELDKLLEAEPGAPGIATRGRRRAGPARGICRCRGDKEAGRRAVCSRSEESTKPASNQGGRGSLQGRPKKSHPKPQRVSPPRRFKGDLDGHIQDGRTAEHERRRDRRGAEKATRARSSGNGDLSQRAALLRSPEG